MNGAINQGELASLLRGREERVQAQRSFLALTGQPGFIQITLNIPGLPKKMDGEAIAMSLAADKLTEKIGREATASVVLTNGAGTAFFLLFSQIAPEEQKKIAVEIEESAKWARILDIDVITDNGSISRDVFAIPPRRCLLCGEDAKFCARSGTHKIQDLRDEASRLLSRSFNSVASVR